MHCLYIFIFMYIYIYMYLYLYTYIYICICMCTGILDDLGVVRSGQELIREQTFQSQTWRERERDSEDVFIVLDNVVVRAFTSIFMARN